MLTTINTYAQMADLVDMFKVMGWNKVLEFRQDWNEAVICQFYATLEVQAENEKLIWMTGTRRFEATFKDLADVHTSMQHVQQVVVA